jgi:hypothetical protein
VRDDLAAGRLVEVPLAEELELTRVLRAVWRADAELPASARQLLRLTRASAAAPLAEGDVP